jgi:hypothetical protein
VTEYEQRVAQKKALAIREKMKQASAAAATASVPPVRFGTALPGFMRSIEKSAPAMSKTPIAPVAAPVPVAPVTPVVRPELMPMYEAMLSTSAAMSLPIQSSEMKRAIVDAAIGVIMKEAQAVRDKYA